MNENSIVVSVPSTSKIIDSHGKEHALFAISVNGLGVNKIVQKKFSDFKRFDASWRSKYPSVSYVLPARVWIGNRSERVMAERQEALQEYLQGLLSVGSILPYLSKFLSVHIDLMRKASLSIESVDETMPISMPMSRQSFSTPFSSQLSSTGLRNPVEALQFPHIETPQLAENSLLGQQQTRQLQQAQAQAREHIQESAASIASLLPDNNGDIGQHKQTQETANVRNSNVQIVEPVLSLPPLRSSLSNSSEDTAPEVKSFVATQSAASISAQLQSSMKSHFSPSNKNEEIEQFERIKTPQTTRAQTQSFSSPPNLSRFASTIQTKPSTNIPIVFPQPEFRAPVDVAPIQAQSMNQRNIIQNEPLHEDEFDTNNSSLNKSNHHSPKVDLSSPTFVQVMPTLPSEIAAMNRYIKATMANQERKRVSITQPRWRAIASFEARLDTHLPLKLGEFITLIDHVNENGWWFGANAQGQRGYFPSSFVEQVEAMKYQQ